MSNFAELTSRLHDLALLKSTLSLLYWDSEVNMPKGGVDIRSKTISYIRRLLHEKFLDVGFEKVLLRASEENNITEHEQAVVREVLREFTREKKLPSDFVQELSHVTAEATHVWAEARHKSDFSVFQPYLENIVALKRKEADLVGFKNSPYDALLDVYEPYLTTAEAFAILEELKDFLIPFAQKIASSSVQTDPGILHGNFNISQQQQFNRYIAKTIGFNFESGRFDSSTHPFAIGFHPDDVRITTRFVAKDMVSAVLSSLHEAGHGLYEQGLARDHFGTPLSEVSSTGIHESQSRLWENMVGRSRPFWAFLYPQLQKIFPQPFQSLPLEKFYPALNAVSPSLIRVEADEVTYNLHIILRFEIEKQLVEGSIRVNDLPDIWNAKMKEYFNVEVANDAEGVLQDIHWSNGLLGYFPTYTLGNLYSAQLYRAAQQQIPQLETLIAQGKFAPLRDWLRTTIHIHGRRYSAAELIKTATGENLSSKYFTDYLTRKYSDIYQLATG